MRRNGRGAVGINEEQRMKILERLKILDVATPGCRMRPFHGVAYYDMELDHRITAVVPLNWLIAISRAMWGFLKYGSRFVADSPREAYRQGFHAGRDSMRDQTKND